MEKRKTVLVFGTFNPVTNAHIHIGKLAKEHINADRVLYILAHDKFLGSWKQMGNENILHSTTRIALLQEAIAPYGFEVEDAEAKGIVDGKTYNTVAYLHEKYPNDEFYLCMGIDKIPELDIWYEAEKLIANNKFLIIDRDGKTLEDVKGNSQLVQRYEENFISVHNTEFASVNATEIRKAYKEHEIEKMKKKIPTSVYNYLHDHKEVFGK